MIVWWWWCMWAGLLEQLWLLRETSLKHPSKENPVWWIYFENHFASGSGVQKHSVTAWGFTKYKSFITTKEFQ